MVADCRRCVYFKPSRVMNQRQAAECVELANVRGQECLGWCMKYRRGVTYYTGPCRGYRTRSLEPPKATLATFWPGLKEVW